jgi:DNA-binding GntR family transcriptional regulator
VVRQVTARDVREICQVRRILECAATRSACGRIDLPGLHRLRSAIRTLMAVPSPSESAFIQQARLLDSQLHDLIAESCGNAYLANELSRLKTLFRAFRDVAWEHDKARNDYHRIAEEGREHLSIVEALLKGDGKSASQAMAHHIRSGVRYWSRSMPTEPTRNIKSTLNGKGS